ncbi:biflaviolin synthase [Saccharopolyspora shandongensis]|uniref:Biflaviolin synthase n=1 Tax=Saccharopolyspora shandongensis TaxID=418495 RepID=A0A1H2XBB4_9PSEU|nr:cytochrome P450 [Saccharopolyspora shandongensis]SDW89569.1 biflaviolin synthase [Saccharopolyspora shandongensis]
MSDRCPVRCYVPPNIAGVGFDPDLAAFSRDEPVARIRMQFGSGEAWLVTRYEDVKFVTSDPRFSRAAIAGQPFPRMTKHIIPLDRAVSYADPPGHARIRRVAAKVFAQRNVERLRARAEQVMAERIAALVRAGSPADLVEHVVAPFPMAMIGDVVGVPEADRPWLMWCAETLFSMARDESEVARNGRIKDELYAYFHKLVARRRGSSGDDLLTVLGDARDRGEIDDEELGALVVLVSLNGWHAVRYNSSNMVYVLLTEPGLRDRLVAEPGLVPHAVEELLRFIPHKRGVGQPRVATEDVVIRGVRIRAGDVVHVSYVTANWDPEVFPDPERFDLGRAEIPHVAFGHGPHYCVGPLLARMESQVLLGGLVERLPRLRLAVPPEEVRWRQDVMIRGPVDLPVAW